MILGLGNDIVDIRRIEKTLNKPHGDTFKKRVFTEVEIAYCDKMAKSSSNYAARWALKEAFYKALPESLQSESTWRSIELVREPLKKPYVRVIEPELKRIFEDNGYTIKHSISHERDYCTAVVLIEKEVV